MMKENSEDHLERIKIEAIKRMDTKYRVGQHEHGGYLPDIGTAALLEAAIDEALDQVVYLLSMRELIEGTRHER